MIFIKNVGEIEAVAFDIDGTLYPQWKLHIRAIFNYIFHCIFYLHYGLVRAQMHGIEPSSDFMKLQAEKMAQRIHKSPEEVQKKLDRIVYKGLAPYFNHIPCYKNVPETFKRLKEAGLKIALLSDFPPEQKGEIWGVKKYCDVILGTESLGALKPEAYSFKKMAEQLGVEPSKILYVGNSYKYDVVGAHNAGMKTAYLLPLKCKLFKKHLKDSEICFSNYRQFMNIVLE